MFGFFDSFQFIFGNSITDIIDDFGVNVPEPGQGGDDGDSTAEPVFETSLPIEPEVTTIDTASFDVFAL